MPFDDNVQDINHYNQQMALGMVDKMFFLDRIPNEGTVIDFGCADGTLIEHMSWVRPKIRFVGFDINEEMCSFARKRGPKHLFTSDWEMVKEQIQGDSTLVLSSVIHEIHSYLTEDEIQEVWDNIWSLGAKRIVIRDMSANESMDQLADTDMVTQVRQKADEQQLLDWENVWGSIDNLKSLTHFLLTYRYVTNWQRELVENYFSLSFEELVKKVPEKYSIKHMDRFVLPFVSDTIRRDFDVSLPLETHVKMILEV